MMMKLMKTHSEDLMTSASGHLVREIDRLCNGQPVFSYFFKVRMCPLRSFVADASVEK